MEKRVEKKQECENCGKTRDEGGFRYFAKGGKPQCDDCHRKGQ